MHDSIIVDAKLARAPRRTYTKAFKAEIVAQCDRGDRSLAQIAMEHQINANLVRKWQQKFHDKLDSNKLVPVQVNHSVTPSSASSYIEINVGHLTLKLVGNVDSTHVASLVRALR